MKSCCFLLILLASSYLVFGQQMDYLENKSGHKSAFANQKSELFDQTYPVSVFALSFNPLGFLQYGPTVNAELGITKKLVFHVHVRFISYGLLTASANYQNGLSDNLGNFAFGCGPIYFFGNKKSKPYLGIIVDGNKTKNRFSNSSNYSSQLTTTTIVYSMNTGYRFRFNNGFFFNTGIYVGVSKKTIKWDVADIYSNGKNGDDNNSQETVDNKVFFTPEFSLGYEF